MQSFKKTTMLLVCAGVMVVTTVQAQNSISTQTLESRGEFGVVPFPIPQFGVVPDSQGRTIYNTPQTQVNTNKKHYYGGHNGFGYHSPQPYYPPNYYPGPVYNYPAPAYNIPIGPAPNGYIPPYITSIPLGGTVYGYPTAACGVCHYSPCHCRPAGYYPQYPSYPYGYYPPGYYGRDTRSNYGNFSFGNNNFRVSVGGSSTSTQSSTTYGGVFLGR